MFAIFLFSCVSALTSYVFFEPYVTPYFVIPGYGQLGYDVSRGFIERVCDRVFRRNLVVYGVDAVYRSWSDNFGQDEYASWFDWRCYYYGSNVYSWPFRSFICPRLSPHTWHAMSVAGACLLLLLGYLSIAYVVYRIRRGFLEASIFSMYVSYLSTICKQPDTYCSNVRNVFTNSIPIVSKPLRNHSHPTSASTRNAATRQMELVCAELGKPMYMHQMSASDARRGIRGSRAYFWGKDLAVDALWVNPADGDIVCMNDVDMYMDMPMVLANHPRTYMLSTFQPTAAAATTGEFSFTFNNHNSVTYKVSGGARYEHPIWNYGSDVLVASTPLFMGLAHRVTSYTVDRRQTDDHHQLICLTPIKTVVSPLFALNLGGSTLKRLVVAHGSFGRVEVVKKGGVYVSTSFLGGLACATIPSTVDDLIASVARNGTTKITPGTVRTLDKSITQEESIILSDYHRHQAGDIPDTVYSLEMGIGRYQYSLPTYNPSAKTKLISFMTPIVPDRCFSPDVTRANEQAAVKARVIDVATQPMVVTPHVHDCMKEFAQFLIPDNVAGTLYPTDMDEVYERQNRPEQRRILDEALRTGAATTDVPIDTFVKPEAYAKPSEPRLISTIPGINKAAYSAFIYSFSKILRAQPWYAFAKKPVEIAGRIAALCMSAVSWFLLSDFSKMDGRVSNVLRMFEWILMTRAFHPSCHTRLGELMNTQKQCKARSSNGVVYETGDSRLSGSPETADFNSVDNAFTAYLGHRMTVMEDGTFMSPEMAWAKLGIYGGDDGGTPDLSVEMHTKASALVGQVVEGSVVHKGEAGVSFLAREYSNSVWYGDCDSMCDVKRQMSKFHSTVHLPGNLTPMQKLAVKCASYYLTDKNTPIIGDLSTLVVECFPELKVGLVISPELRSKAGCWFAYHPEDVQYPNERGDWMFDAIKRDLPEFDFEKFKSWLDRCKAAPGELLTPPLCYPVGTGPKPKEVMIINREVVEPDMEEKHDSATPTDLGPSTHLPKASPPCFAFKKGKCTRGDACKYAHVTGDLPACRLFQTPDGCKFGASCGYPHVKSSAP